ncbi:MAG: helix-turn-helix domain-containing protein [Terrimicrobiaceae bacterium]|nr:helix-turn-helix domain-containing protein [Terrimicrobiaceae bacterium]
MGRRILIGAEQAESVRALGFRVWKPGGPFHMPAAHTHSDVEVNFLLSGGVTYLHGGVVATVKPLHFTAFWGGVPHCTISSGDGSQGFIMTLPSAWLLEWQLPHNVPARLFSGEVFSGSPNPTDPHLLERWLMDFDSGAADRRRILLLEIQARFHRLALEQPEAAVRTTAKNFAPRSGLVQVGRITDCIARRYREPLSVDGIAAEVGLHGKYMMRLFKQLSGMSVWEYVCRMRLSHAQRLLLTTDMKVIDIALDAGFASLGPFYRAFAAYCPGIERPLDYRRGLERLVRRRDPRPA